MNTKLFTAEVSVRLVPETEAVLADTLASPAVILAASAVNKLLTVLPRVATTSYLRLSI